MGENPSWFSSSGGGKAKVTRLDASRYPVEQVSWEDAVKVLPTAREREKTQYRLPTEAEWEYACRAGTKTQFSFGNDPTMLAKNGWSEENSRGSTHVAGLKAANAFGLYDMHGNVREWCQDWYAEDYYSNSPSVDPTGPLSGRRA